MKIYRPMISAENKPIMVEEEPQDMNDDSERCVALDDLKLVIKDLKDKIEKAFAKGCTEIKPEESDNVVPLDDKEVIELIDNSFKLQ